MDRASAAALLDACRKHELYPLLAAERDLPAVVAQELDGQKIWQRLYEERAALFARGVARVQRLLAGEPYLFLKGVDYAGRLYGSFVLRPMKDIDVLVPASRYEPICASLAREGVAPIFPGTSVTRAASYHERAFALDHLTLEVHQAFIQTPRHSIDYDALWSRVTPGHEGPQLAPEDAIAYHALVLGIDQFLVRLGRFADLVLLLDRFPASLEPAARRAHEWKSLRTFYGTLAMACRLFPDFETAEIRTLRDHILPARARRILDRWVLPSVSEVAERRWLPSRPVQLWRKFALLDDWTRRRRFAAYQVASEVEVRWRAPVAGR